MDPILLVLAYSAAAAAVSGVGSVPVLVRRRLPLVWIGWANALAAGLMLGAAYALMVVGPDRIPPSGIAGTLLGVGFVVWTHVASGTSDLDLNRLEQTSVEYGYKVLLVGTLHSAAEGIAIGVAMTISLPFGALMALAIAAHNVPEATVLSAILTSRGVRLRDATGLSIMTNVSQVLLALVTFALSAAAPGLVGWFLGFAVGAMVYLVMAELLPQCYRQAGPTTIALVTIVAMGFVVILVERGG